MPLEKSRSRDAFVRNLETPSREFLAYVAGFFDGEGCVNFTRSRGGSLVLRAFIANTNREMLEAISERLPGGSIVEVGHGVGHWKRSYQLRYINHHAADFVMAIEPWLFVKAEQAIVAIGWSALRELGPAIDPEAKAAYALLAAQLTWLNKKGPSRDSISPIDCKLEGLTYAVD